MKLQFLGYLSAARVTKSGARRVMAFNLIAVHHIQVFAESQEIIWAEQVEIQLFFGFLEIVLMLRIHFLLLNIRCNSCLFLQQFAIDLYVMCGHEVFLLYHIED